MDDMKQNTQQWYSPEDEINIIDLWGVLVKKKLMILVITISSTMGAIVLALISQNIYKVETILIPPTVKQIEAFNIHDIRPVNNSGDIQDIEVFRVYNTFRQNLSSKETWKKVFDEMNLMQFFAPNSKT